MTTALVSPPISPARTADQEHRQRLNVLRVLHAYAAAEIAALQAGLPDALHPERPQRSSSTPTATSLADRAPGWFARHFPTFRRAAVLIITLIA